LDRATHPQLLGYFIKDVFAAGNDQHLWKTRLDGHDEIALYRPLTGKHGGYTNDVHIARDALYDFIECETLANMIAIRVERPDIVQAFADTVDQRHLVPKLLKIA